MSSTTERLGLRLSARLGALFAGLLMGALGTVSHQYLLRIGSSALPVGLVLALVGVTTLLLGLRLLRDSRVEVFLAALGLLGTIFLLSLEGPGGSVLVPAGLPGTIWTLAPTLIATVVLAWPRIPSRVQRDQTTRSGDAFAHDAEQLPSRLGLD